jgi:hypothetical protein
MNIVCIPGIKLGSKKRSVVEWAVVVCVKNQHVAEEREKKGNEFYSKNLATQSAMMTSKMRGSRDRICSRRFFLLLPLMKALSFSA